MSSFLLRRPCSEVLDKDEDKVDGCRICIKCRLLLRRLCSEIFDKDEDKMERCRIYIKYCLLLGRPCSEVLDETRNRWADVVFTLNVVFYSEAVYGGSG
jgi:hypothetical protein